MKIYLDLCAIQRPLDTPDQVRIALESEAVLGILALCDHGIADLLSSEALMFEGEQSRLPIRREHTMSVLSFAKELIFVTSQVRDRAMMFVNAGLSPIDALHIASAEAGQADYFCTCDDKLIKKSKRIKDLMVRVINPINLVQEIDG